jgi:hypothetical protein
MRTTLSPLQELAIVETCIKTAQRDRMTIGLTSNKQHLGLLVYRLWSISKSALCAKDRSLPSQPRPLLLPLLPHRSSLRHLLEPSCNDCRMPMNLSV